tara:strand:+ start:179 stop:1825 length:1647 start_codon:yes stop_codon:yes gene_type:complete
MAGNHMSELSPRQRMINMMYLVLTALLALNISKEVLEAFQTMDNSIGFSYSEKVDFNKKEYDAFKLKALNNPEKLSFWNDVADDVKNESSSLISVIDTIRLKIQDLAEVDEDGKLIALDDKEITLAVLVKKSEEKGYGYGQLLKEARSEYKNFLMSLDSLDIYQGADSIYKLNILSLFENPDYDSDGPEGRAEPRSWEYKYYGHVPVAAMAFMNQMKLDVGNMEGAILELLQKKTGQSSITVNQQLAVVKAPKQTIMLGDSFHAKVFIAGVDTNQLPKFNVYAYNSEGERIDNDVIDTLSVEGSRGIFSTKPTKQGTYYLGGDILVQSEEGEKTYEFMHQYRVDAPMSVISPDKMNVIYTEVINPLSISVPGYSSDELQLYSDFSGCKIKRVKNGSYEAIISNIQKGKNARKNINLFIKHKKTGKLVGKKIAFRVKNVPPPRPSIKKKIGPQSLSTAQLSSAAGIRAKLDNFDFDLKYEITSFDFSYPTNTGSMITASYKGWKFDQIKAQFTGLKPGQKVIFDNFEFKVKGSKNKPRKLYESVVITIL